jgi:uncharacterized protein YnzC (UPF0291/DUF896 family)
LHNPIDPALIRRINELANKQKRMGLTSEEKAEQQKLRTQYLEIIRAQVKSSLDSVKIIEPKDRH